MSVPKHFKVMGYVDDNKIFLALPPSELSDAVSALNRDLRDITTWCCANSLLINPEKTKYMIIGVSQLIRNLPPLPPVQLLGEVTKPVSAAKDLGTRYIRTLTTTNTLQKL